MRETSPAKRPERWVLAGEIDGRECRCPLRPGLNRIGSLRESEVCLTMSGVSKRHAVLKIEHGRASVEDLASKNGTYRNEARVDFSPVEPGDVLGFGPVRLRLETAPAEESELAIELTPAAAPSRRTTLHETPYLPSPGAGAAPGEPTTLVFPDGYVRGTSAAMTALYREMQALALSDIPVLILGETGVGKEWIARILHASSKRRDGAFVALNCAAVPADLLEAELFGIGKGVATGVEARRGRFELARGGTLLLDEIGDMPPGLQVKLLRVLQEKVFEPLGSTASVAFDTRVLAATHTDPAAQIEAGALRADLYYRLAGFVLEVPPLARRRDDIPALVGAFLRDEAAAARRSVRGLTVGALERLAGQPWPGNVRQLEHEVRRLVHRCPNEQAIDSSMLSPAPPAARGLPDFGEAECLDLAAIERRVITEALRRTGGNRTRAAALLGISRESLRRRLRRLDISPDTP